MLTSTILTGLVALVPSALAVGKARVVNNCAQAATLWSVGSDISAPATLAPKGSYAETFVRDPKTGGKALKITLAADGLYTGAPQTDFAYSLDGDRIWYDLSDVFGDPFAGKKLTVEGGQGLGCPTIVWAQGTNPGGSQTRVCKSEGDVTLTLCA
ncbi:hypothetical protein DL546_003366 [Coniochaeta pulveracea]|uniref:Bys1 family protein n=1 Tax=Coniochaeta pulveracea TaxID=177199 RepID=A0A420XZH0_9PEZI|nr:hypothetical protein DL546_003366 [Coniochaeta pulveracea]